MCVDPKFVREVWPFVKHLIVAAMHRGDLSSFLGLERSVMAEGALLWLVISRGKIAAAAVTELQQTEWRKVCVLVACGGERMREWLPLIAGIEKFARQEGCSAVRIFGRKGWQRVLTDFCAKRIILEKEII
ncbi:MAG TPA: hypothetical protein VH678_20540 [Xanthobacteraceae bacterium]